MMMDTNGQMLDLASPEAVEDFFRDLRWPNGTVCPFCGSHVIYQLHLSSVQRRRYKCRTCRRQFSVTKGTILEGSKLPLADWIRIVQMLCENPSGLAVTDLRHELNISYKAAQNAVDRVLYARIRDPLRSLF